MCCWLIMRTGSMARTSQYSASILHSICKFFINFAFYSNTFLKNDRNEDIDSGHHPQYP